MFSGALDASRFWSSGLNRLGWGCTSAFLLAWGVGKSITQENQLGVVAPLTGSTFLSALVLLLASGLLGSMAITLGASARGAKFSIEKRTQLAERIGRLSNPLLDQIHSEAILRFEMAAGMIGTISFGVMALLIKGFSENAGEGIHFFPQSLSWSDGAVVIFLLALNWLLEKTATETFEALETVAETVEARLIVSSNL